ncbi:MAG: hypothetical protein JNM84_10480 [Planctomycetes bacterium]|nr:hypothetical protein [Planctomycetota bacterium]
MDSGTRRSDERREARASSAPEHAPQPGKLRLFFAVAFAVTLAWRLGDAVLPASIHPLVLGAIAFGAPLAGALAALALHRGLFDAIFDGARAKARRSR